MTPSTARVYLAAVVETQPGREAVRALYHATYAQQLIDRPTRQPDEQTRLVAVAVAREINRRAHQ